MTIESAPTSKATAANADVESVLDPVAGRLLFVIWVTSNVVVVSAAAVDVEPITEVVVAGVVVVVLGAVVSVDGEQLGCVKTSLSRVTAPLRASARPCTTTALCTVIDVSARMLPTNTEPVPRVAELPT